MFGVLTNVKIDPLFEYPLFEYQLITNLFRKVQSPIYTADLRDTYFKSILNVPIRLKITYRHVVKIAHADFQVLSKVNVHVALRKVIWVPHCFLT